MPLGLYIAVPFCRSKCSYCNFASDVFSRAAFDGYITRLCSEIELAWQTARDLGANFEREVDTIYFGGGTPTLLDVAQLRNVFVTIRQNFDLAPGAEITVEGAPGTLSAEKVAALAELGVNRVSLGVQSFVDREAAAVGRLHKRATVAGDIVRLRAAGISNLNVDLIAGLPHQTRESWEETLHELIATEVPHASVYMLEVDEDSRLGSELLAGGQKYHAHFVPDEDLTADLYEIARERLNAAGIRQYEISNFARPGFESKHNLKYWTRRPYLGFGVDAHSMLPARDATAVRFSNPDSLEKYSESRTISAIRVTRRETFEECFLLGLRLNRGVELEAIQHSFPELFQEHLNTMNELVAEGLAVQEDGCLLLTSRGRLLSNDVLQRFVLLPQEYNPIP